MFGMCKSNNINASSNQFKGMLRYNTPKYKISYDAHIGSWCLYESTIQCVNFAFNAGIDPYHVVWFEIKRARSDTIVGCQDVYKDIKKQELTETLYLD
jgi:hypothetical protein